MANITITVQSLLNTAVYDAYTIDNAQTINQLKTAIETARGFSTSWFDIVYNGSVVSGAATLASLGIVTGTRLRTHNKIARLATLELRQKAKLDLAALDRAASGETRDIYDITELPTQYSGNNILNNPNTDGLLEGRPWIAGVVTQNLRLNLDPDNSASYSGSGTTWTDLASPADNVSLVGSPTYTSGTPSYFTFNGTTQYAIGSAIGVVPTTQYTKSVWFYLNGYADNNIFSGDGHFIYMGPGGATQKLYCGHANWPVFTAFPSTATISLSTWYNATLTFSTTNGMTLYINGVQDSTYTADKSAHTGTGTVSIASYGVGNLLNGRVGKVLCYGVELSASQVLLNYNVTKATYGL